MKFAEKWLVRFAHIFLTSMVLLLMFLKDTELHTSLYNGQLYYVQTYIALVSLSTLLYFVCTFIDPGYVNRSSIDPEADVVFHEDATEILTNDAENADSESLLKQDSLPLRRQCRYCNIMQPLRAKHCEECKRCVRRYDHHCPWIANCVGEGNHKFFLSFLCAETALIAWSAYVIVCAIVHTSDWRSWFKANWMFLVLLVFLALSLLVASLLSVCHSYMMFTAQTTWEFMSRPRISYLKRHPEDYNPFDKGYCRNVISFLCYFRYQSWDEMYQS